MAYIFYSRKSQVNLHVQKRSQKNPELTSLFKGEKAILGCG